MRRFYKRLVAVGLCIALFMGNTMSVFANQSNMLPTSSIKEEVKIAEENTSLIVMEEEAAKLRGLMNSIEADIDVLAERSKNDRGEVTTYRSSEEVENEYAKEVFKEMEPEAQKIYLEYISMHDEELLEYYKTHINPDSRIEYTPSVAKYTSVTTMNANAAMSSLRGELVRIGLSTSFINLFMNMGSSIIAAAVDPIGVSKLVLIITGVAFFSAIIANWDTISREWSGISSAFARALREYVSTNIMISGFRESEDEYDNFYLQGLKLRQDIAGARLGSDATKHMEVSLINEIRRSKENLTIYKSSTSSTVLFVYKIGISMKGWVNEDFYVHDEYQVNLDIRGARVFILYDSKTKTLFHAHLRLFYDDTVNYRKHNKLDWKVYPLPMQRDTKYFETPSSGGLWLNGNIYTRL